MADKNILAIAQRYATHYQPTGQVLRYLRCMQFHLAQAEYEQQADQDEAANAAAGDDAPQGGDGGAAEAADGDAAEAADGAAAEANDDNIPLNESHPGQDSNDEDMDVDGPPVPQAVQAAFDLFAAPRREDDDMLPGFSQTSAMPSTSQATQRRIPSRLLARYAQSPNISR